ncbi:glycosyltransferase [Acidothermus cellulolyticus]|uniref:glycosyltransferase n=1 Tax=Acidothermus cellulolyticus TaxID=28049 RepID=UPI00006BF9E8|nr:glycosyltransferase [Acidothermus cellulolyticus]
MRQKLTQGVRRVCHLLGAITALRGEKPSPVQLVPVTGVRQAPESPEWEAVDIDPQFLLAGHIPSGWVEFRMRAGSRQLMRMRLYLDRGAGFHEADCIELGTVATVRPVEQRAVFFLPPDTCRLRLDPMERPGRFTFDDVTVRRVHRFELPARALYRRWLSLPGSTIRRTTVLLSELRALIGPDGLRAPRVLATPGYPPDVAPSPAELARQYTVWIRRSEARAADQKRLRATIAGLRRTPTISVLVPVHNAAERWLRRCIDSVLAQSYPYWQLCLADDASSAPHVRQVLEEYAARDARITAIFRPVNGHISAASNSALDAAQGDFIALLDHDDELAPDALLHVAALLNEHPDADMIYSDEDKINEDGVRQEPFFKPDWSPELLLSHMYTCHLGVYRTELVRRIGGFRLGFEGSQDYDLVLRLTEQTDRIYHIPRVLYHWRRHPGSAAASADAKPYAYAAAHRAIREALHRRGAVATVEEITEARGNFRVHYAVSNQPLISIVVAAPNTGVIDPDCIRALFDRTAYPNIEVIVVHDGRNDEQLRDLLTFWHTQEPKRFRVESLRTPARRSRLMNHGADCASGDLLVFLHGDVAVGTADWLDEMAGYALREEIGAVGPVLLRPDGTIDHAGFVLGIAGGIGHPFRGFPAHHPGYFNRLLIPSNVAAVSSTCLMVRCQAFHAAGGFDDELSGAIGDADFCLRLRQRGHRTVLLPYVRLCHYAPEPEVEKTAPRQMSLLRRRWATYVDHDPYYNPNLTRTRSDYSLRI